MFKDSTGRQSQPGEKQLKQVTKVREVTYIYYDAKKKKKLSAIGNEIVEEVVVALGTEPILPTIVGYKTIDTSEKKKTNNGELNENDRTNTQGYRV